MDEAATYNFTLKQGYRFLRTFTFLQSNGNPHILTGYSARLIARTKSGNTKVLDLSTTANASGSVITLGGSTGAVTVNFKTAETSALDFDDAGYDLKLIDPSGEGIPFMTGVVSFDRQEAA